MTTFLFGDSHTIVVKKVGYQDDNKTNHIVQDPENVLDLYLPIKQVSYTAFELVQVGTIGLILSYTYLQYPVIINATTNDDISLSNFEVFIDDSPSKTSLEADNTTTTTKFDFGSSIKIVVKKIGHVDANVTAYLIQDKENIVNVNLPKKRVSVS